MSKVIQTSKEYVNGKWQKVNFTEDNKGNVSVKLPKKAGPKDDDAKFQRQLENRKASLVKKMPYSKGLTRKGGWPVRDEDTHLAIAKENHKRKGSKLSSAIREVK